MAYINSVPLDVLYDKSSPEVFLSTFYQCISAAITALTSAGLLFKTIYWCMTTKKCRALHDMTSCITQSS